MVIIIFYFQVPRLLKRLHELQKQQKAEIVMKSSPALCQKDIDSLSDRPFAIFSKVPKVAKNISEIFKSTDEKELCSPVVHNGNVTPVESNDKSEKRLIPLDTTPPVYKRQKIMDNDKKVNGQSPKDIAMLGMSPRKVDTSAGECSNSNWSELKPFIIGTYCMSPLGGEMQQRLILQYLTPLGEYQEVSHTFLFIEYSYVLHFILTSLYYIYCYSTTSLILQYFSS